MRSKWIAGERDQYRRKIRFFYIKPGFAACLGRTRCGITFGNCRLLRFLSGSRKGVRPEMPDFARISRGFSKGFAGFSQPTPSVFAPRPAKPLKRKTSPVQAFVQPKATPSAASPILQRDPDAALVHRRACRGSRQPPDWRRAARQKPDRAKRALL